jgi:hypothetical protein
MSAAVFDRQSATVFDRRLQLVADEEGYNPEDLTQSTADVFFDVEEVDE